MITSLHQTWFLIIPLQLVLLLVAQLLPARWRKRFTKIGLIMLVFTCAIYFLKPIGQNLRSKRESKIHEITALVDSNDALQDGGYLDDQDHLESDDYHEDDKREMINDNFIIPWSFGNILSQNNNDDDDDVQEDIYVTEYDVYASYAKLFHDDPTDYYMVEEDPYITEYLKNNKNPKIRLVADMMGKNNDDHKNGDVIVLPSEGDLEEEDDIFKYENAL